MYYISKNTAESLPWNLETLCFNSESANMICNKNCHTHVLNAT